MYDGRNPSALRSQALVADALDSLMAEKGFADISVSELCTRAGVSRQTFYKLFGSKENVVLFQLKRSSAAEKPAEDTAVVSLEESCVRYARYIYSNYAQMRMLVDNGLSEVLGAMIYESMAGCRQSLLGLGDEEREYAARFSSAGLTALAGCYIARHDEPDLAELARIAYKIMSGAVFSV